MAISAKDVMELRKQTDCGMMECKKALTQADGDFEKAIEILREQGLAAANKKAGRIAAEGMVYAVSFDNCAVVVEVNAETDFVAKNDKFVDFTKNLAKVVADENPADVEALMACKMGDGTVDDALKALILVIKENIKVRRFARYEATALPMSMAAAPTASSSSSRPLTTSLPSPSSLLSARTSPCRSLLLTPAT